MSTFIENNVSSFRLLSVADQKSMMLSLLGEIKDTSPKFQELLLFIQEHPIIRSDFLVNNYQTILELIESIEIKNKGNAELRFKEIQKKMNIIKENEKNLTDKDSADTLLQNL